MDWQKLWNDIKTFFSNNWLNMIWFVLALVLGIILIKIICGLLSKGLAKKMDRIVSNFIVVIVKFCLCMVLVFVLADRKSTRLNSSHSGQSRMPSSA